MLDVEAGKIRQSLMDLALGWELHTLISIPRFAISLLLQLGNLSNPGCIYMYN